MLTSIVDAFHPMIRHGRRQNSAFTKFVPSNVCLKASSPREQEIRRKIQKLKKEGRLGNSPSGPSSDAMNSDAVYGDKVRQKLGKTKSQMLGFGSENSSSAVDDEEVQQIQAELDQLEEVETEIAAASAGSRGQLGARTDIQQSTTESYLESLSGRQRPSDQTPQQIKIDPSIFDKPSKEPEPPELSEAELVELVAEKLAQKREREEKALQAAAKAAREKRQAQAAEAAAAAAAATTETNDTKKTTTGVGGTWTKSQTDSVTEDTYKPKSGSWGAFPRPRDISKAYGGGRRVGAGYSKEDDAVSKMNTQKLLKDYRRKVGIDVPTEKEHAAEIEEALRIGQLAMQRGIYATAVSALEKVTKWCSTNSKVGSKVYLELAMAYEAVGRTKEAYQVYKTLSECRMEDVKYNAKRLLYGMEAMEIMRDVSSEFSRKKTRSTFIDATGLDTIAQNFDDVYNTAYVDLDGGFYKKLTESVVRSNREARQILLKATGKGEVGRTRIVQALRCISRQFDESLQDEIASNDDPEPTAFLNGKPIIKGASSGSQRDPNAISLGDFQLLSPEEMVQNLQGEWKLQLLADRSGDGVSFFNTTLAVQKFSVDGMTFEASGPSGLVTMQSSGRIEMDSSKRILSRLEVQSSGGGAGGLLNIFTGSKDSGFAAAVSRQEQIISVDSILLITKRAPGSRKGSDADKEHFAVWRRECAGTPMS
jgi:tetratricopeptide (TPR) repeat protein